MPLRFVPERPRKETRWNSNSHGNNNVYINFRQNFRQLQEKHGDYSLYTRTPGLSHTKRITSTFCITLIYLISYIFVPNICAKRLFQKPRLRHPELTCLCFPFLFTIYVTTNDFLANKIPKDLTERAPAGVLAKVLTHRLSNKTMKLTPPNQGSDGTSWYLQEFPKLIRCDWKVMKNLSIPNCLLDTANCSWFQYTNSLTQVMKWKDKYNLLRHEPDIHPEKLSPEIVPACFFVKRSTKTESNHTTQNTVGSQKLIPIESMFVDGPKWKSSQEYPNNTWILGGMSWPNPKSRNSTLCYMNAKNETGKKVWIFIIKVMANDILFANVVFQLVIFKAETSPFVFFLTKSIVPPPPLWPRTVPPAIAMMHKTPSAAKETGPQPVQKSQPCKPCWCLLCLTCVESSWKCLIFINFWACSGCPGTTCQLLLQRWWKEW